ncbi:MAG: hypothetical protein Q9222_006532 [Ikaeria aurantiellina]
MTTTIAATAPPTPAPASQGFSFNPATAIYGEFKPGQEGWKPDSRSRRQKAIARNKERAEATNKAAEEWAKAHPQEVAASNLRPDAVPFQAPPRGRGRGRSGSRGFRGGQSQGQRSRGAGRGASPQQQQGQGPDPSMPGPSGGRGDGDDGEWRERYPPGQGFRF